MNKAELVDDFLYETIESIREKVYEDNKVDASLILSKVASPVLMDLLQLNKAGASSSLIEECISEQILVHKAILETLEGIQKQSQLLFENTND